MAPTDEPQLAPLEASATASAGTRPLSDLGLGDEVAWSLVDAAPDGIVMTDEAGRILLVNRQTEVLFGYDRGELLGRSVDDLLPVRLRQVHRAHRTRYRADPRVRLMGARISLLGCRKDGTEFPVEVSLSPLAADGELRIVAVVRDITDRVEMEAESKRVRDLLDATRDGVFMFDRDTLQFTYVNLGAIEQVGYERDELLTMTPLHIAPQYTEAEFRALLAPLVAGDAVSTQFLTVHRRRDGEDVPVEVVLQADPHPGPGGPQTFVAIVRDVRERLETEERLRNTEQELRLLEDHERIARDLHDIVIQQLFASGMTLQGAWSRIKEPDIAQRIATVVDDLDRTIREIRTVIFGLQTFGSDVGGTRGEILRIVSDERAALGFEPHVRFDGTIETVPRDVTAQLLPTLREALSNVARHAHASAVDIDIATTDDVVVLRVTDDGVGIPDANDASNASGEGIRNMTERAACLGGRCELRRRPEGGTVVEWSVPTPEPERSRA